MSRGTRTLVGTAGLACVVCCIGPILAWLGAIGALGIAGMAVFGGAGAVIALLAAPVFIRHRRRRRDAHPTGAPDPVQVATPRVTPAAQTGDVEVRVADVPGADGPRPGRIGARTA